MPTISDQELAALRRLADEAELRDLVNRYFYGLDRRDGPKLRSIYAPTGVERSDGIVADVAAHVDWLLGVRRFAYTHHVLGSASFEVNGDRASGDVYALAFLVVDSAGDRAGGPTVLIRGIQYLDGYLRTPAGWKIGRRHGPIPLWQFEAESLPPAIPGFVTN